MGSKNEKARKRSWQRRWGVFSTVIVAIVLLFAIVLVGFKIFGYQIYTVMSGSMEPVYHDKELVWVQRTQDLRPGEVGIFIYDDCGYIKLLETVDPSEEEIEEAQFSGMPIGPRPVLVSYNSEYEPIEILPGLRFDIIGRVLT